MPAAEPVGEAALSIGLWDDNPADVDLLGFDAVVAPIISALRQPDLDPITVGVHAPWGGGKSTLLGLLAKAGGDDWIIVQTNPWEYDDQLDVKGTLIAEVLARLEGEAGENQALLDRFEKLFKRISWSRVGIAVARGVLSTQWDPEALIQAFNPKTENGPQSLAQFRTEFAELLAEMPRIQRVVVLVDDLDRCLPPAVVSTLEAIKLFLSVKKMAFVIAADQDMVRDAVAASLSGTNRGESFAKHYLEKIVQLPISLPRLSPADAEAYITLLLVRATDGGQGFAELIEHWVDRRRRNLVPLLGDFSSLKEPPSEEIVDLAAQIADGLAPSSRGNPREIKRFLNAFGVRSTIAASRGVRVSPAVLVKMLLLEAQHRTEFERLVSLADGERGSLLAAWEAWGRGETETAPDGIRNETRAWAAADPPLVGEDLNSYISLAATFAAASMRGGMSDELRELVRQLVSDSEAVRDVAADALAAKSLDEQRAVVDALIIHSRHVESVVLITEALIAIGKQTSDLAGDIALGIHERMWRRLEAACALNLAMSEVEPFVALARAMAADESLDAEVQQAASDAVKEV